MAGIFLTPTTSTPGVRFDDESGLLVLRGESYPENAFEFFRPLLEWVRAFLATTQVPVELELALAYLNTSSVKSLLDLLDLLEEAHRGGRKVVVTWLYDPENERALEMAEEFREEVTLPFTVVPEA